MRCRDGSVQARQGIQRLHPYISWCVTAFIMHAVHDLKNRTVCSKRGQTGHCIIFGVAAYFDVRVFNPFIPPIDANPSSHVREVEHGSFIPPVMSLLGGVGNAAKVLQEARVNVS